MAFPRLQANPNIPTIVAGFDQATDFPYRGLAFTMKDGVCGGLALCWIKGHKDRRLATFKTSIMTPSSIRFIENFNSKKLGKEGLIDFSEKTWKTFLEGTKLTYGPGGSITKNPSAKQVADSLGLKPGYQLCTFKKADGAHTVAIAQIGATVELFDPNHGQASFPDVDTFRTWFREAYWNFPSGPNNPPPCSEFAIMDFIDDPGRSA